MEEIKERALDYLQSNPHLKELYHTEDGFLFENKVDALTHAKSLNSDHPTIEIIKKETEAKKEQKSDKKLTPNELKALKEKKVDNQPTESLTEE